MEGEAGGDEMGVELFEGGCRGLVGEGFEEVQCWMVEFWMRRSTSSHGHGFIEFENEEEKRVRM